jgi:transposase InsO family protein
LRASTSGFYASQQRPELMRARRDRPLRVRIAASHEASHRHCGRPRISKDLREEGERVSEKRVARLMRAEGLRARARKRFRSTTVSEHDQPVAANVLARQFTAARLNQRWVGDATEFIIGSSGKSADRGSVHKGPLFHPSDPLCRVLRALCG